MSVDREKILWVVVTSTAIETGEDPKVIYERLKNKNSKWSHLKLGK